MKINNLTIPVIVAIIFLAFWFLYAASFHASPLYADSLFTIGAGARLASEGHFSSTFMLYGLINPFTLEALLRLGFGESAPDILRLFNLMACLAAAGLIASGTRQLIPGKQKLVIFVASLTLLSSVILLIDSMELTPEVLILFSLAGLFRACMLYRSGNRDTLRLAVWIALLIGSRPTAVVLILPAFLIIASTAPSDSWMKRIWSISILLVLISASVLTAFPDLFSTGLLAVTALPLILLITFFCWVHDFRAGDRAQWTDMVRMIFFAAGAIVLLFPHYIIHFTEMKRQILQFHLLIEQPAGTILILGRNCFLGISYLTIVLIGPLASVGFFAFTGNLFRERSRSVEKLTPFLLGTIPFFFLIMRSDNFQSRYLIPLLVVVFIPSILGLLLLFKQRKLRYLLLLPLSLSLLQTGEAVYHRGWTGGILNTFKAIPDTAGTVSWHNVFPCEPGYYAPEGTISWPLNPFISGHMETTGSIDDATYAIAFREIPEGFEEVGSWGVTGLKPLWAQIRESANPNLTTALQLIEKPWMWRLWSVSFLCRRIQ